MDGFFSGFLVGLVLGVWATVVYYIVWAYPERVQALIRRPKRASRRRSAPSPGRNWRPPPKPGAPPPPKALDPTTFTQPQKDLYRQLISLTHNEPTAQRLIVHERATHPDLDLDAAIDHAIDKLLHDRRA